MRAIVPLLFASAFLAAQAPAVTWEESLAAGLKRAKAEKKRVLVDVWAEWCPPCQRLKKVIFPAQVSQAALAKVVPVSLMVEKKDRTPIPRAVGEAERFKVNAFPTLVLLDADGKEIKRQVGSFADAEGFAAWLKDQ